MRPHFTGGTKAWEYHSLLKIPAIYIPTLKKSKLSDINQNYLFIMLMRVKYHVDGVFSPHGT